HIFKLGRKYSQAMGVRVLDAAGQEQIPIMGTYGIGVSRVVAEVIEQSHDASGIVWPDAVAPFRVLITPINLQKSVRVQEVVEKLYLGLTAAGIDTALDDRGLRPGPMFADADLIGIPHRITVGERGLEQDMLEYKHRRDSEARQIPNRLEAVLELLKV
ncbi:MAG: His/Gly/Thr/Pro-type tRNA ligase C-terminal domain-containing protein, partial [Nevskiales bacterium]